jgi:hypothetical protein
MDREESEEAFGQANSWKEFTELWSKFYSNDICIPAYYGKFIDENGDNPQANAELGKIFQDITRNNLICVDSQVSVKGEQKAYCIGYTFQHIAKPLFVELNKCDGIIAILFDLKKDTKSDESFSLPYVTYCDWNQDGKRHEAGDRMLGNGCTHLGIGFTNEMDDVIEWLNDDMKEFIEESNMRQLKIWDANASSSEFRLFEVIRNSLNKVKMQNELFTAVKNGDFETVTMLIERMKSENVIPDIQQSSYGDCNESMISQASINFLRSEDDVREKFEKTLDVLMNEVKCLNVNMYRTLKHRMTSISKNISSVLQILKKKLPEWYKDD